MGRSLDAICLGLGGALLALGFAGACSRPANPVSLTRTTGATVAREAAPPRPMVVTIAREGDLGGPVLPPEEPWSPATPDLAPSEITSADGGPLPLYERPPLHEPHGSTYSDVGFPYPLPDVPAYAPEPPAVLPPVHEPAFPETSFGAKPSSAESGRFPESSFGPDAAP